MDVRERAAQLRAQGNSYRAIADELGVTYNTAYKYVNPEYAQSRRDISRAYRGARRITRLVELTDEVKILQARLRIVEAERNQLADRVQEFERRGTIESFTDAQAYWLATVSPEEFERIARGLAEWEYYEMEEAA